MIVLLMVICWVFGSIGIYSLNGRVVFISWLRLILVLMLISLVLVLMEWIVFSGVMLIINLLLFWVLFL